MTSLILTLSKEELHVKSPKLRATAGPVEVFDEALRTTAGELIETLVAFDIGVGLAAPQVGVPLRLFVVNLDHSRSKPTRVFINPRLIVASGKKDVKYESCLSLPGYRGQVERRKRVQLEFHDLDGHLWVESFEGFEARVMQHELDHLDGILYSDRTGIRNLEPFDFSTFGKKERGN